MLISGPCLWLVSYVERAKAVFFTILTRLYGYQRERSGWKLLPDRQIVDCNGEPTEFEHESARLCYLSYLSPSDLRNRQSLHLHPEFDQAAIMHRIHSGD